MTLEVESVLALGGDRTSPVGVLPMRTAQRVTVAGVASPPLHGRRGLMTGTDMLPRGVA